MERKIICRIKSWLNAESKTGTSLMGDDGPVTRIEVILANAILLLLAIGACSAGWSVCMSAACALIAGILLIYLNKTNRKDYGK